MYLYSGQNGTLVFTLSGEAAGDLFGSSMAGTTAGKEPELAVGAMNAGPGERGRVYLYRDVDGDGRADLVVGAYLNGEGAGQAGKVYVFSGKDGSILREITGTSAGDTLGFDATGLGDVNGDGARDLLVTAAWNGAAGLKAGRVYVIAGEKKQDAGGW